MFAPWRLIATSRTRMVGDAFAIERITHGPAYARPERTLAFIPQGISTMNKTELVDAVAADADLSKADASRAVDAMIDSVTSALKKGDKVSLVGFGVFSVRERAARQGRNPKTGQSITIPAGKTPGFKAGKALKDAVN